MRKLKVIHVSMAILYLQDDQHSDIITQKIIDSDLTELSYLGNTPERTVNSQLRTSKKFSKYFIKGSYPSHYMLDDEYDILEIPEVRLALYCLKKQESLQKLKDANIMEMLFIGCHLTSLRNEYAIFKTDSPIINKIEAPTKISKDQINNLLTNRIR